MARSVSVLTVAVLLAAAAGCRCCGSRGLTSSCGGAAPCQLVGRSSAPDVCADPVVGLPPSGGGIGPGGPVTVIPGPQDELPYPATTSPPGGFIPAPTSPPSGLIPAPGVPVQPAVPAPAPAEMGANVLPAPRTGVPVKGTK